MRAGLLHVCPGVVQPVLVLEESRTRVRVRLPGDDHGPVPLPHGGRLIGAGSQWVPKGFVAPCGLGGLLAGQGARR